MHVCVIGTGYVGLVTGVCLAHVGHDVVCIDVNEEKVKLMQSGQSPIFEPGLSELMKSSMATGHLQFSTNLQAGVEHGEILFIAVGTPALPTGESDTRYVEAVAKGIGSHLNGGYKVIVNKSTVPIGSGDWVRMIVMDGVTERQAVPVPAGGVPETTHPEVIADFDVVSNPEFLREGSAVYDTFNPDRIVLGSNSPRAIAMMKELYTPIVERRFAEDTTAGAVPVVVTDLSSAEMVKYASNAFLATKISFINEVANICDRVGADITQVAQGIGLDSRIKGKTVGLLGLTFKPDTDDMRDAPSLILIEQLNRLGAKVKAYDPIVSQSGLRHGLTGVIVESDASHLADSCDALVLVTDWQQFKELDYAAMGQRMNSPIMIDGRNFLDREAMVRAGFQYMGIGR